MPHSSNNKRTFYVVQFLELPFEGIDDYVCVPYTWLVIHRAKDQKSAVAYPKDEDPFDTRDRVKRKERYDDKWRFYMATVKYESDTYRDAEYWIATRNDYEPLVEEESKLIETQPRFTLNKKLRSANRSQLSKFNDNSRKPLPQKSIKRPALSEPKKELERKRLKLDEAYQSSPEPGCSNKEQSIIIQDHQSMECVYTQETAAASKSESRPSQCTDKNPQESLPTQEPQQLNMPLTDDDTTTVVIGGDKEGQPTSIMEQELFSIQVFPQFAEQLVQKPQIAVTPSMEINNHINSKELRTDDVLQNEPTSHHLLDSLKMSAHLYSQMKGARRLVPIQKPVEKRIRPVNFVRKSTVAAQNPSNIIGQTGSLSIHSVEEQSSVVTQNLLQDGPQVREMQIENSRDQTDPFKSIAISSQKNQHVPKINVKRSHDVAAVDPRNVLQSVTNVIPASENLSNSSHKRSSFVRGLDGHTNSLAQEQYRTPPLIHTKVLNSIRQALSTTHNNSLVNEQQTHVCQSKGGLANENHLKVIDKACQTEEYTVEKTLSPYHAVSSDFDTVTDHEVISDHEVPTVEAPTETRNTVHSTGIASERSCAEGLTAAQKLPNHQTHPRVILEQQMLDNFATLFTQMGSTLRYTCDMYGNLRSSIVETAETYRNLLDATERFNEVGNSGSNASSLNNLTPVIPQDTEQNHTEIPARASFSNENQLCNDVADRAPKKSNIWRFVLPPNYDSHDTRWTLKYRRNMPGLVELMPQSGIYVSYGELVYCKRVSKDCKSLARRLLLEIFNRNALSVCLSMSEKAQAPHKVGSNVRPELDVHACTVLFDVVLEYGLQCGWNTDLQPILSTLHSKIQEIRFKYGVMVKR